MIRDDRNDQVYKTKDGKWAAVAREIETRHAGRSAGAGGDDLGRGLRAALRAADQAGDQAHGAQRQARVRRARGRDRSPRRAPRARSRSPPTWPAAASTSSSAAMPSTWPSWRSPSSACSRGRPTTTSTTPRCCPRSSGGSRPQREEVLEAGGLFIIGTERHESRRIDNQLRGRSGRQGDPGESRFFLSAQDDLVRLFAGRADLQDPRPPGQRRRRGQRGADRGRDALQADREGAEEGRGAALPDAQAHARVRRRAQPAARGDLHLPRRGARGPRHVGGRPRGDRQPDRASGRPSTPPASSSRTGTSTG